MNFTVLFPSRSRPSLLIALLRSIEENTADKVNLEVLVGYDYDDVSTVRIAPFLAKQFKWLRLLARKRSTHLTRDYHNWLYGQSKGKFIIICNDDVIFRTPHWDKIALNHLNNYLRNKPDGIVYGWISDSLENRAFGIGYCCFPLVSRRAADTLGYVMHNFYTGWNADIHLYQLYNSVGRVCNLSDIWIDHISHHTGKRERDSTNINMERISNGGPIDLTPDRQKLMAVMKIIDEPIISLSTCAGMISGLAAI